MEKRNEILTNFKEYLKNDVKIESLNAYTQTTDSLNSIMSETSDRKSAITNKLEGKAKGVSIEEYVESTDSEISGLAEKFAKVIGLTKQLETDEAIKVFLAEKIHTIFKGISDGAGRIFNLGTLEIFTEMMEELGGDMEQKLVAGIEQELFSVKTSFGEFEKVYEIMEQQFAGINQAMTDMKDRYLDQMKLLRMALEIATVDFPKMSESYQNLKENFEALTIEVAKKFNDKETELKDVSKFLEKSPKYQILYLINNMDDCSMEKLKGLTNIDESIITLSLKDLHEKDLITLSGEGENLSIKIKQKFNPLSYLELPSVFDSEAVTKFKNYSDLSSFEEGFNQILTQINEYKDTHSEAAGYLLSVLYLYIYESKNFQFYDKIHKLYQRFKKESFYLKIVENALHNNPWESKKDGEIEGILEPSKLSVLDKSLDTLEVSSEEYPKTGPFVIESYKPLSLLVRGEEVKFQKSQLNFFTNISDLLKWVWLNGKGTSFLVKYQDATGKKSEVIVSATPQIDAQLFVKKFDVRVS